MRCSLKKSFLGHNYHEVTISFYKCYLNSLQSKQHTLPKHGIVEFATSKVKKKKKTKQNKKQAVCDCMRDLCLVEVEFSTPIHQNLSSKFSTPSLASVNISQGITTLTHFTWKFVQFPFLWEFTDAINLLGMC